MATFANEFELCVGKYSENTAILCCNNERIINKLTYTELNTIVLEIYSLLVKSVDSNSCIGVLCEDNLTLLPALILSINKHKSAFYCIDSKLVEAKISELLNRIGIKWILTLGEFNSFLNATLCSDTIVHNFMVKLWKLNGDNVIFDDISYVIQTSGTTGVSKCVKVLNNCIMSNLNSLRNIFLIDPTDIIYFGTPMTFDPFIIEIMLALTTGACLLIVPYLIKINNTKLLQTLFPVLVSLHSGVTFLQMVPSLFLRFPDDEIKNVFLNSSLKILALGGEQFPESLLNYKRNNLRIFNLYGITEVSCWASVGEISSNEDISLGVPLNETCFELRDDHGQVIEHGEGELFIGSNTRICLLDNEIITNNTIFRSTGDIVHKPERENKFYYLGRKNTIIKRYGHRICLSQIEKLISTQTQLNSTCIWHENKLILFILLKERDKLIKNKIIDRLRIKLLHTLPESSNPDIIEIIPSIPVTQNGKIDKDCLAKIVNLNQIDTSASCVEIFQNLFSKYFGLTGRELDDRKTCNFFELGGNSILALQIISEYDDLNPNDYSSNLLELILDRHKNYKDYCDLIYSKISTGNSPVAQPSKKLKLDLNSISLKNTNTARLTIIWKCEMDACVDANPVSFEHPRFGASVAIGSHANIFLILNAFTGEINSKTILPDAIEGTACVTECKQYIFIGCNDGNLYKINIDNGDVVWTFETASDIKSKPILCDENKNIIFGSYDSHLYCISVDNATLLWKLSTNGILKSDPIIFNNFLYIASLTGTCYCISIAGKIIWKFDLNTTIFGSACIIIECNIILWADVRGNVYCFDIKTGDKLWTHTASEFVFSSLRNLKTRCIFGCSNHCVYCFDCTKEMCKEIYKINIGSAVSTTPYIFSMRDQFYFIIANNKGTIYLFDLDNGVLLQMIELKGEIFSSPIVYRDRIYVGCRDNCFYCIDIEMNKNRK